MTKSTRARYTLDLQGRGRSSGKRRSRGGAGKSWPVGADAGELDQGGGQRRFETYCTQIQREQMEISASANRIVARENGAQYIKKSGGIFAGNICELHLY